MNLGLRRDGLVVSMTASHVVGRGFASQLGQTIIKMVQTASLLGMQAFE